MIHPDTKVRTVSEVIGNGVFATVLIPQGTIVVVRDQFDTSMTLEEFRQLPALLRNALETYLYHDCEGNLILSWDHARLMNHSCECNTMLTAYGFEIAVRDIQPGEEMTTEYGLLNIQEPYQIHCGGPGCRGHLRCDDIDRHGERWDALVKESMQLIASREQPLMALLDSGTKQRVMDFQRDNTLYTSVRSLKWRREP